MMAHLNHFLRIVSRKPVEWLTANSIRIGFISPTVHSSIPHWPYSVELYGITSRYISINVASQDQGGEYAKMPPAGEWNTKPASPTSHHAGYVAGTMLGPVQIRNMVLDDAEFAGRNTVEAFRSKFEWAVGKNK